MIAKHVGIKHAIIYRPNCKTWGCNYCGAQRGRWFMFVAAHGHEILSANGKEVTFATITSHRKVRSVKIGILRWRANWPKLLRRMKRASAELAYIQIPEQCKDGAYHVHLLTTATVSKRWLKDNAASCGFGYIAEIEPVQHAGKAASYIAKYLTKDSHKLEWPKYFRRVNTSQNWPRPEPVEKSEEWAVTLLKTNSSVWSNAEVLRLQGWHVAAYTV